MKNKLIGGFGLVAWPAEYGETGVQRFIANQDGEIYQKDIAPLPNGAPLPIARYDPDPSGTPWIELRTRHARPVEKAEDPEESGDGAADGKASARVSKLPDVWR
jgi:hypothetical protein